MVTFPYETPAILVEQPLGAFYIARLPARLLLEVGFSDLLRALGTADPERPYTLVGTQRELQHKRLTQIGDYIDRDDAAFPNAIILAANIRPEDGLVEEEPGADEALASSPGASDAETQASKNERRQNRRWYITDDGLGRTTLHIPTNAKLAAVIDGQHRLWGFAYAEVLERLDMDLSCAIYMDLPKPFQAQLFATINSNQKRVDKSLTYEMFGYNIEDDPPEFWTPDKLAVFLTRRLGADPDSALSGRIAIAPRKDTALEERLSNRDWKVSTAVVVDGILRLVSSNPKRDGNAMVTPHKQTRDVLGGSGQQKDTSPLRLAYIRKEDAVLYQLVKNYLTACKQVLWDRAQQGSFITKTVGIQAQFDVLRALAASAYEDRVISVESFASKLGPARDLDFSADEFRNASGSGRSHIRRKLLEAIGDEATT